MYMNINIYITLLSQSFQHLDIYILKVFSNKRCSLILANTSRHFLVRKAYEWYHFHSHNAEYTLPSVLNRPKYQLWSPHRWLITFTMARLVHHDQSSLLHGPRQTLRQGARSHSVSPLRSPSEQWSSTSQRSRPEVTPPLGRATDMVGLDIQPQPYLAKNQP